jgi:hypothetical protein
VIVVIEFEAFIKLESIEIISHAVTMARATRLLSTHFERDAALKKLRYVGIAAVPVVIIAVTLAILGAAGVLIPKKAASQ